MRLTLPTVKAEGKVREFQIPYPPTKAGKGLWAKEYSLNAYYAGKHWARRRQDADYWHSLVRRELKAQGVPPHMATGPVTVSFWWDDRLDIDNHAAMGKMIVDALKGWLFPDDSRRYVAGVAHYFHKAGYILVRVEEGAGEHEQ